MAKWIPICRDDDVYDIKGKHTWAIKCYCSECEYQHKFIEDDIDFIFCPKCGSIMLSNVKVDMRKYKM